MHTIKNVADLIPDNTINNNNNTISSRKVAIC